MGRIFLINQDSTGSNSVEDQRSDEFSIPVGDRFDLTVVLESIERNLILRTLHATNGAQAEAARRMGLSRSALAYKLMKYGIRTGNGVEEHPHKDTQNAADASV